MTALLMASDLAHRLRTGGGVYEPRAVEIDWRSAFDDRPVLETGFDADDDSTGDEDALRGDLMHHPWSAFPDLPPWRDQYVIRPAVSPDADPS